MNPSTKSTKSFYSETEAADALGLTLDEFRHLIRSHIVDREDDMSNVATTSYQPADLLVLKLLRSGSIAARPAEPTEAPA